MDLTLLQIKVMMVVAILHNIERELERTNRVGESKVRSPPSPAPDPVTFRLSSETHQQFIIFQS